MHTGAATCPHGCAGHNTNLASHTMATLILCYGMISGQCGTFGEYLFPTMQACQTERKFVVANRTQYFVFAVCRDGAPTLPKEDN